MSIEKPEHSWQLRKHFSDIGYPVDLETLGGGIEGIMYYAGFANQSLPLICVTEECGWTVGVYRTDEMDPSDMLFLGVFEDAADVVTVVTAWIDLFNTVDELGAIDHGMGA